MLESSRLSNEELGPFLRREGPPESVLAEWKAATREALGPQKKASGDSRKVRELEKQLRRTDKALPKGRAARAAKKSPGDLGDEDDDTGPKSDE